MLAWDDDGVPDSAKAPEINFKENCNADAVIAQLISACQQDQVEAVFDFYERLRRIDAPLYEGVYKMMVLCCLRTHHLDMALEVVDWMKAAGHRPSAFLFLEMLEAYAAAGDAGKVQCVWSAVDEARLQPSDVGSILHRAVMHLVTLRAPTMAMQVLEDGEGKGSVFAPDEFASLLSTCEEVMREAVDSPSAAEAWRTLRHAIEIAQVGQAQGPSPEPEKDLSIEDLDLDLDIDLDVVMDEHL
jgi:hypothetical protein